MNSSAQIPNSFAVNNPHLENSCQLTFTQIIAHHFLYVGRPEAVQIQNTVDREINNWLLRIHGIKWYRIFVEVLPSPIHQFVSILFCRT